jgi:hypothetical protein
MMASRWAYLYIKQRGLCALSGTLMVPKREDTTAPCPFADGDELRLGCRMFVLKGESSPI